MKSPVIVNSLHKDDDDDNNNNTLLMSPLSSALDYFRKRKGLKSWKNKCIIFDVSAQANRLRLPQSLKCMLFLLPFSI